MNDDSPREDHFVQSLARGLQVIKVFGPHRAEMSLSDVAREGGLTRAAARRYLLTLVDLGYMRTDGRLFRLAPRILELGYAYLSSLSLPRVAGPHLEWLVRETGESSSMSVLDSSEIVYVARVPTTRIMTVAISVGTRFPAHATSMGLVLLAGLERDQLDPYLAGIDLSTAPEGAAATLEDLHAALKQVRNQGFSLVDQEIEQGLRALAAPVHDRQGRVIAAISVSAHVSRLSKDKARRQFLPLLLEAAQRIETDLRPS
ncbi:MAG: putative IclR-family transcriptional regulator [Nocardioides sp.]|uniref:IclR family transcriptional regulator domain-containing protein n=1 Tax=Nocardioides sp. TaxID=35761 RepID=UPI00260BB9D0|nr:IclR family transcriptional regulator C-terminal domain-containing protein [Nocardioides sp.]MCW2835034.1 putative IclR-family transcriptional regulator [Nocardioides sp.]